jgi:GPH family glycoside/pentoside/hexuronide:cation symporter
VIFPIIGQISDNSQSPFGRRKPFLLIGTIFSCLGFTSAWMVVSDSVVSNPYDLGQFFWELICSVIYFTGFACFQGPYNALFPEIVQETNDRFICLSATD